MKMMFLILFAFLSSGCAGCGYLHVKITRPKMASSVPSSEVSLPPTVPSYPQLKLEPARGDSPLIQGTSYQFGASGGVPPYQFEVVQGGGAFKDETGLYQSPLFGSRELLKLIDSVGNFVLFELNVWGWENRFTWAASKTRQTNFPFSRLLVSEGVLYVASTWTRDTSAPTPSHNIRFFRSADGGLTWIPHSTYQLDGGARTRLIEFYQSGDKLILQGQAIFTSPKNETVWFMAESGDQGRSWSTIYRLPTQGFGILSSLITEDGYVLLAGFKDLSPVNGSEAGLLRCHLEDRSCLVLDQYTSTTTHDARYFFLQRRSDGRLYVVNRNGFNSFIRESSDQGLTWRLIETSVGAAVHTFTLNSEGNRILYGGSTSVYPDFVAEITYDEVSDSWARTSSQSNLCNGWYVQSILVNATNDALLSCYDTGFFSGGTQKSYIYRKLQSDSNWVQMGAPSNLSAFALFHPGDGKVYRYSTSHSLGLLSEVSSNFGSSWTSLSVPVVSTLENASVAVVAPSGPEAPSGTEGTAEILSLGFDYLGSTDKQRALLRRSFDQGQNWSVWRVWDDQDAELTAMVSEPGRENLFVGGNLGAFDFDRRLNGKQWKIEKYHVPSAQWTLTEIFAPSSVNYLRLRQLLIDESGRLLALGHYNGFSGGVRWVVRTSADGGEAWSESDLYQYIANRNSAALGGAVHQGLSYVVGFGLDSNSRSHWLVRMFDGTQWTTVDDEVFSASSESAQASAITISSDGTIYVGGSYRDSQGILHWIVKQGAVGSSEWTIIDDFVSENGAGASALSLLVNDFFDEKSILFVGGSSSNTDLVQVPTVRVFKEGRWQTILKQEAYVSGQIHHLAQCHQNKVCAAGEYLGVDLETIGFVQILQGSF